MVGGFDQIAAGLIRLGPEDTAAGNGQVFGRQSVVDSHVAHILVIEVARVAGRVAFVIHVCFALLFRVVDTALAAGVGVVDQWMFGQQSNCVVARCTVFRVGVQVARDHEMRTVR